MSEGCPSRSGLERNERSDPGYKKRGELESSSPAQEATSMGLEERRKIKELQDVTFPERVHEIEEICGKSIPYDVDWTSFADDMEGLKFLDNISCHRLNMALRTICIDDMGREAVRETLTQIKLKNVKSRDEMKLSFEGGVLEMHCAYALRTDGMYSDREICQALMQKF